MNLVYAIVQFCKDAKLFFKVIIRNFTLTNHNKKPHCCTTVLMLNIVRFLIYANKMNIIIVQLTFFDQ